MNNRFSFSRQATSSFILLAGTVFVFSALYPALNWPDELYKVYRLPVSENYYLWLINYLSDSTCRPTAQAASDMSFGANRFLLTIASGQKCYFWLKMINALLIIGVISLCTIALQSTEKVVLLFQSLMWPASIFYLTGINQQVVFHVVSISIVILSLYGTRLLPLVAISLALTTIDRSFITLSIFLSFLSLLKVNPKLAILTLVALVVFANIMSPIVKSMTVFLSDGMTIGDVTSGLGQLKDSPIKSLMILFISSVYLGGTSAVFGVGLDYLIVAITVFLLLKKNWYNVELRIYLAALFLTYFTVVSFVPTIQSFRYYVFILPAVLYFMLNTTRKRQLYMIYSFFFVAIYLIQAEFIRDAV